MNGHWNIVQLFSLNKFLHQVVLITILFFSTLSLSPLSVAVLLHSSLIKMLNLIILWESNGECSVKRDRYINLGNRFTLNSVLTHIINSIFQYNHDTSTTRSLNFGGSDTHAMSLLPSYVGYVALY